MLVKIVSLFLVFMVVMGAIHKWLYPDRKRGIDRLPRPRKCGDCGRFLIGSGDCTCRK